MKRAVVVIRIRFALVSFGSIPFIRSFRIFAFVSFSSRFVLFLICSFIRSIHLRFVSVQSNSTTFVVSTSVHLFAARLCGLSRADRSAIPVVVAINTPINETTSTAIAE